MMLQLNTYQIRKTFDDILHFHVPLAHGEEFTTASLFWKLLAILYNFSIYTSLFSINIHIFNVQRNQMETMLMPIQDE